MEEPWNPTDRFKILCKCSSEAVTFMAFTENSITAGDALNLLLLNVIIKTRVF